MRQTDTSSKAMSIYIYVLLLCWKYNIEPAVAPDILPMEAMDSTNLSRAGNGDFPRKYVVERSLVQALNANSWGAL